jgi:hypothetical protein
MALVLDFCAMFKQYGTPDAISRKCGTFFIELRRI